MPLETFTGRSVARLLARAQAELGTDAVIVQVSRSSLPGGALGFQLTAADASSATGLQSATAIAPTAVSEERRLVARPSRGRQRVIAVVGPTGAGKTTTIAKLAYHPDIFADLKVGLLCLDTFKIGGVEQLENYAKIEQLPIEVAYDVKQLSAGMRRLRSRDVVLVDTPGRSPRSLADVSNFTALLRQLGPDEIHLALPAGLNREYARSLLDEYAVHGITHVLRTKVDEFPRDTSASTAAGERGLSVRWVTYGQNVPHDIKPAEDELLNAESSPSIELQIGVDVA